MFCDVVADLVNLIMKLFAEDTKMYGERDLGVSNDSCAACDRIMSWVESWQMCLFVYCNNNTCTKKLFIEKRET
jgi:hypothetical protein